MPRHGGIFRYLLYIFLGYVIWLVLYEMLLLPHTLLDESIINILVHSSEFILSFLGFQVSSQHEIWANSISLDNLPGVWVSPSCDGLSVVAIFIIVVLSFPGNMKRKVFFISFGACMIEAVNVIRIVCLSLIHRFYPHWLKFNHDYTFTVLVYSFVILLWWWWFNWNERSLSK